MKFYLLKTTKMAISQNAILANCQSPKSLLLLHFSMNLSETFRIGLNMDFANKVEAYFWFRPPRNVEPKKLSFFLNFGPKIFLETQIKIPLETLFAKSIFPLILKVSDKFIGKCRSRGFYWLTLGQNSVLRYGHFCVI